jgi:hypothetical protein
VVFVEQLFQEKLFSELLDFFFFRGNGYLVLEVPKKKLSGYSPLLLEIYAGTEARLAPR